MKKFFQGILAVLLTFCVSISFSSCGKSSTAAHSKKSANTSRAVEASAVVAQNETYSLRWDEGNKAVFLIDKQSGHSWGTIPFQLTKSENINCSHVMTRAALVLGYIEPNAVVVSSVTSTVGAVRNGRVLAYETENGVRVEYHFDDLKICVPVSYTLLEDGIRVSCVPAEITESENKVYSVALSPMMASAENNAGDAWLFVPSGSGALIDVDTASGEKLYGEEVYGTDPSHNIRVTRTNTESIRLPVFGAKQGNEALLCVISDGAETASIRSQSGNERVKFGSVYADFAIRGVETAEDTTGGTAKNISVFSENKNSEECLSVSYFPLHGENADYVGMAKKYREYLSENGFQLEKKTQNPLFLNILGGVQLREFFLGIPYYATKALTTVKQAGEIIASAQDAANVTPIVKLIGFGTGGINAGKPAGGLKIGKAMGTASQLKNLGSTCKNKDIPLFIDFDLVYFSKSGNGISKYFDRAKAPNKQAVGLYPTHLALRNPNQSYPEYHLVAHDKLDDLAKKAANSAQKLGFSGISFNSLSNTAYSDYATSSGAVKGGTAKRYCEIAKKLHDEKLSVSSSMANAYAIQDSDYLFDVPLESSKFDTFSTDIPFYEMVFRGYVSMGCYAVNTSFDQQKSLLLAAEAGCGLTYSLIGNFEKDYLDSTQNLVGSMYYKDVLDTIGTQVKSIKALLDCTEGACIVSHKIDGEMRIVEYDNGVKVLVNYSKQAQKTEYGNIPAENFKIIHGEDKS